jgi:hypothetical protein
MKIVSIFVGLYTLAMGIQNLYIGTVTYVDLGLNRIYQQEMQTLGLIYLAFSFAAFGLYAILKRLDK